MKRHSCRKLLSMLILGVFSFGAFADESPVIIRHGDTKVTVSDVRQAVNNQVPPESQFQMYGSEKKLREFIGSMFVHAKLAELGAKRDLTPEEQWRVDEMMRRIYSQIEIEREVQARSNPEDIEEFAREVYLASPERYTEPEQVRVRHILVSTAGRSDDEAQARAVEVRGKLEAGHDFEEVAKEYSDDRSVEQNNGDLGFFARDKMVKPFEEAAFGMKEAGEVAGPVKTQFGYHVIEFVERRPERLRTFEEVKPQIMRSELAKHRERVVNELVERIGKLDGVEINNDAVESLIQRAPKKSEHSHSHGQ